MFRRNGALSGVCFCVVTAGAAASLTREINKDRERVHVCVCVCSCVYVRVCEEVRTILRGMLRRIDGLTSPREGSLRTCF